MVGKSATVEFMGCVAECLNKFLRHSFLSPPEEYSSSKNYEGQWF